jgi:cellulose synthase operon protein C
MIKKNVIAIAVFSALAGASWACGPDFPLELLQDRAQTLQGMPSGEFFFEATQLLAKPAEKWTPEANLNPLWFSASAETPVTDVQEKIETEGYTPAQVGAWRQARTSNNATDARAAASALPLAHQHYLAGAVAFNNNDFDGAQAAFSAIKAMGKEGLSRAVWAEFMLGRLAAFSDATLAIQHFAATRSLANAGAPDPLGLAVASLGAEAQFSWRAALENSDGNLSQNLERAVTLYATQAAVGSQAANASLLIVARKLNSDSAFLQAGLRLAIVRKLMTSYAFSRGFEAMDDAQTEAFSGSQYYVDPNLAAGTEKAKIAPPLLDAILAAAPDGKVEGADRFAAALYRAGRFDAAAKYARVIDSPLAHWLQAKLALRAGDQKLAAAQYAKAIQGFPANEKWVPGASFEVNYGLSAQCRTQGEAGTLALSKGDFLEALELFYRAGDDYSNDMAYIAERVIGTDELLRFTEANTKPQTLKKFPATEYSAEYYGIPYDEQTGIAEKGYQDHVLRAVLARRLMREGKYEQALAFFNNPNHLAAAKKYSDAMRLAEASEGVKKAEALFTAATLAREQGIDFLGFQLSPDFAVYDGGYGDYEASEEERAANPGYYDKPTAFISSQESERLKRNAAQPNKRFHYRFTAVKLAEQAVDLVPARSQAFAAMLCKATSWVIYRDSTEGERLYARYLKQGAYVPWGGQFGTYQGCPKPEFSRAQAMLDQQSWAARKHIIKKALPFAVGGFGLLLGLGVFLWWRGRKAKSQL